MPMELSFRLVLAIVVGIVIVLSILMIFWGTVSKFLPWTSGFNEFTVNQGTKTIIASYCTFGCTSNRDTIRSSPSSWKTGYDLNGDGELETISCSDGSILQWGKGNQPSRCGGLGCEKSCSCVDANWGTKSC